VKKFRRIGDPAYNLWVMPLDTLQAVCPHAAFSGILNFFAPSNPITATRTLLLEIKQMHTIAKFVPEVNRFQQIRYLTRQEVIP